ncbi:Dolichyl-diphosphooligosaccharide--protein glycosyltransferase subunit STT3 [Fusarium odoratissimum]|uniref:dolichyl-diphosphooligosaccharide--protein glycotransferase n=1 Tax=Fusarium oxysporum f. sp. cubense (strain race 4) TaxID=2502994 RepID=N1RC34_FUSC4|nr:Dolichyl-diphosphooligosaccharide--protein glycosyltransferase subunit STT3 [Fusarium odoratissimum]
MAVKTAKTEDVLAGVNGQNTRTLLRVIILLLIAGAAVSSRLFSVILDPWFNFRATKYLVANGFYKFWDWFDDRTWHPLGRVTGGTLYPGLMVTSGVIYHALRALTVPVDIHNPLEPLRLGPLTSHCRPPTIVNTDPFALRPVLRWSALGLGIFYGFTHQRAITASQKAEHAQHEYEKKEKLIQQAKAEFAKKNNPTSGDSVITDPSDPKFDLEKLLLKVQKESP